MYELYDFRALPFSFPAENSQSFKLFTKLIHAAPCMLRRNPPSPPPVEHATLNLGRKEMNDVIAKSAVTLTLAAALMGQSVLAHADRLTGTIGSTPSITIKYGELDISKPQDLEVLYTRIKRAAKSVCGFDSSPRELSRGRRSMACYQSTLEDAVRQVNQPTLTALHRTRTKSGLG